MKTFIFYIALWFCIVPNTMANGNSHNSHDHDSVTTTTNNTYSSHNNNNFVGALIAAIITGIIVWAFMKDKNSDTVSSSCTDTNKSPVADVHPELPDLGTVNNSRACIQRK